MHCACTKLQLASKSYGLLIRLASALQPVLLAALRLYFGYTLARTGLGKLQHLGRTAEFFGSLNLPAPRVQAVLAGSAEMVGGTLLLLGLASRLAAIPVAFTMLVAYATAHVDTVKGIFNAPDEFLSAAPFLYLLTAVIILAFGPGKLSIDYLLERMLHRPKAGCTPVTATALPA